MDFPIAGAMVDPVLLLVLGLLVGVLGGFFGVGGGFLAVGGLVVFGVPTDFAVGTGLALTMGSAIVNLLKHRSLGNVDLRLGLLLGAGSVPALFGAEQLVKALRSADVMDPVIRITYVAFLTTVGLFMLRDYWATRDLPVASGEEVSTAGLPRRVRSLTIPPRRVWLGPLGWRATYIPLPASGIDRMSVFVPLLLGAAIGFIAGLLGLGGGFILIPVLMYVLGIPTVAAVGTGLLDITIVSTAGSFIKAVSGSVDPVMTVVMLAAASVGAQLGAAATGLVAAPRIRAMFAVVVLSGSGAVALRQAGESLGGNPYLADAATGVLLGVPGAVCTLVAVVVAGRLRRGRG